MSNVVFRRIRGRIIPIKVGGAEVDPAAEKRAQRKKGLALLGLGAAASALSGLEIGRLGKAGRDLKRSAFKLASEGGKAAVDIEKGGRRYIAPDPSTLAKGFRRQRVANAVAPGARIFGTTLMALGGNKIIRSFNGGVDSTLADLASGAAGIGAAVLFDAGVRRGRGLFKGKALAKVAAKHAGEQLEMFAKSETAKKGLGALAQLLRKRFRI